MRGMLKEAIRQGLFSKTLDSAWEEGGFRFVMGDLAPIVEYARYLPPLDKFEVECEFDWEKVSSLLLT